MDSSFLDRQIAAARAAIADKTIIRQFADVTCDLAEFVTLAETRGAPRFNRRADSRTLRARITSDTLDRHFTVIDPTGISAEKFLRNPVVLWQHGIGPEGNMPIGVVNDLDFGKKAIDATVQFDTGTPLAKTVSGLYQRRILRGFSIGFLPTAVEVMSVTDGAETREVPVFRKWELLELSAVAIPSNPDAVVLEDAAKEAA